MVEALTSESTDKQEASLKAVEAAQGRMRDLHAKMSTFDSMRVTMEQRLDDCESLLQESGTKEKLADTEKRLRNLQEEHKRARDKLESTTVTYESHMVNSEARFEHLMKLLGEATSAKGLDFNVLTRDVDKRIMTMQEENKRARDRMENTFKEELKLEHSTREAQQAQAREQWEREQKARQSYQDSYMEILAQERCTRESEWKNLEQRLMAFEKKVWSFLENGGLQPVRVIEQVAPQVRVVEEVVSYPRGSSISAIGGIDRQYMSVTPQRLVPRTTSAVVQVSPGSQTRSPMTSTMNSVSIENRGSSPFPGTRSPMMENSRFRELSPSGPSRFTGNSTETVGML